MDEKAVAKMVMLEEIKMFNRMTGFCFDECVKTMSSKEVSPWEKECVEHCFKKSVKFMEQFAKTLNDIGISKQQKIQSLQK